jgi:signal transduction histidine kinase
VRHIHRLTLETVLNQLREATKSGRAPTAEWGSAGTRDHTVQFYESDAYLVQSLRRFFGPALRDGETAIVVASEPHRRELSRILTTDGIDVEELTRSGRYVSHDAGTLLGAFMRDGMPDRERFASVIGDIVAPAFAAGTRVRIYGEMVSILWSRGRTDATLRLEELWTDLQERYPFALCCGYPMSNFSGRAMEMSFAEVCSHHSHVHPAESYSSAGNDDERLRSIACMQQRIASLEREARDAERMRNDFLVAVSHDLRTPLSVILGYAQMLRRRLGVRAGEDRRTNDGLQSIERRARMMASVVEELADATRRENGRAIVLHREMVDLSALVEEIAAEQDGASPLHRVVASVDKHAIVGYWDPVRLGRAIVNLIGNAVKYSPAGGEIHVTLRREGEGAVLSIRDTGIGIPADDLPNIFDRFYRGANALEKTAGTGIGLSATRQIIERHGGTIAVESTEGRGSTFVVRLPIAIPSISAQS